MSLKNKLKNNQLTIGSWITIGNSSIIEIMATAGFEWLCIDMEHTSIDLATAKMLITTIHANNIKALVRVSKNEEVAIKKVMDMGADGVIVPMIKSKKDAQMAIDFVKYPPTGKRGVGLYRAQNYGIGFEEYKKWVEEEAIIIAQIEHIEAVKNIEDILRIDGIDGTIVGPYDLSASMGFPGKYNRSDVQKAIKKVELACRKYKKPYGFHVIESDPTKLQQRIDEGCTFLAYSLDFFFLGDSARYGKSLVNNHIVMAYDNWNKLKKNISIKDKNINFNIRDIWFINMGKNIGFEQNGKGDKFLRPVLIIKKFTKNLFFGIPLTSTLRDGNYFDKVKLHNKSSGLLLLQAKTFDSKRLVYKMGTIGNKQFEEIVNNFTKLINPTKGSD
jgi:2-dehydro-3-deoxyglucarate aldolase